MTEQQAAEMLASLARIEQLLMHIANNTSDAIPGNAGSGRARTMFYPSTMSIPVAGPGGASSMGGGTSRND